MTIADSATQSRERLLVVALQDMWHARSAVRERMAAIETAAEDKETAAVLQEIRIAAAAEQDILRCIAAPGDAPNLWAAGILDEACHDIATAERGPARDIALIGAIRTLLAVDIASLETAAQLGAPLGLHVTNRLARLQSAACERNRCLRARLQALTRENA